MSENNEILANMGVTAPVDPLSFGSSDDEMRQSFLRDKVAQKAALNSVAYDTFPIFCEHFLISTLQVVYEQDQAFQFSDDEAQSKLIITTTFNRKVIENRDRRPIISVGFQGAGASNIVLRDMFQKDGPMLPYRETKGLHETAQFRIGVIHDNRNVALYLGQQVRTAIAMTMDDLRETFNLLKVYPPSINGPGLVEEYTDLFGCFIDLQVEYLPKWHQWQDEAMINKVRVRTYTQSREMMVEAIVGPQGVQVGQTP